MRVKNWNPRKFDDEIFDVSYERIVEAAEVVATNVRAECPVGSVTRPMYKTGKNAGQKWTSRDAGRLKKSIRVVKKRHAASDIEYGYEVAKFKKNVRVYAGSFMAWYAAIVEYETPFMRRGFNNSISQIKTILGVG